jgi:hypothetical protein
MEGALCLSCWQRASLVLRQAAWSHSDEDKHKAPASTLPRPLSLQDGATGSWYYRFWLLITISNSPIRLEKIIADAIRFVAGYGLGLPPPWSVSQTIIHSLQLSAMFLFMLNHGCDYVKQ